MDASKWVVLVRKESRGAHSVQWLAEDGKNTICRERPVALGESHIGGKKSRRRPSWYVSRRRGGGRTAYLLAKRCGQNTNKASRTTATSLRSPPPPPHMRRAPAQNDPQYGQVPPVATDDARINRCCQLWRQSKTTLNSVLHRLLKL